MIKLILILATIILSSCNDGLTDKQRVELEIQKSAIQMTYQGELNK